MHLAKRPFDDRQRPTFQLFGLVVVFGAVEARRKRDQAERDLRMVRSERLFGNLQRSTCEGFGLRTLSKLPVDRGGSPRRARRRVQTPARRPTALARSEDGRRDSDIARAGGSTLRAPPARP